MSWALWAEEFLCPRVNMGRAGHDELGRVGQDLPNRTCAGFGSVEHGSAGGNDRSDLRWGRAWPGGLPNGL